MVRVDLMTAGWTVHPEAVARQGGRWRSVRFPALAALITHPAGRVLFDTGYAPRVRSLMRRGLDRVYGTLLPVHIDPLDSVAAQLGRRGVDTRDIDTVVLSHLHADHVGGLLDFPFARVVTDPAAVRHAQTLRGISRLRRGVVTGLLPADLPDRVLDPHTLPASSDDDLAPLAPGRDLFGDDTVRVVPLPGHSPGHVGLAVRTAGVELLLIGDAGWHSRTISHRELPHPVAQIATDDSTVFRSTVDALHALALRRPELVIVPSHDQDAIDAATARLR